MLKIAITYLLMTAAAQAAVTCAMVDMHTSAKLEYAFNYRDERNLMETSHVKNGIRMTHLLNQRPIWGHDGIDTMTYLDRPAWQIKVFNRASRQLDATLVTPALLLNNNVLVAIGTCFVYSE